jgi:acyl-CoA hydrolase
MKFKIKAWCRSHDGDQQVKVTGAVFTSWAIDSGSRHIHPADSLRSAKGDSRYVTFGLDRTAPFT